MAFARSPQSADRLPASCAYRNSCLSGPDYFNPPITVTDSGLRNLFSPIGIRRHALSRRDCELFDSVLINGGAEITLRETLLLIFPPINSSGAFRFFCPEVALFQTPDCVFIVVFLINRRYRPMKIN